MDKDIESKLKDWVKANYKQYSTGWTCDRSAGNAADCFNDGMTCGTSWAAYNVGRILGMELEEPDDTEEIY